jgi:uncharacterized protein with PIN domain
MKKEPGALEVEQRHINSVVMDYKNTKKFFHCKHCIEQFLGSELHDIMTPKDYGMYEVGTYDFPYPKGKEEIVVVWCKRCGRKVWDGRNYRKIA